MCDTVSVCPMASGLDWIHCVVTSVADFRPEHSRVVFLVHALPSRLDRTGLDQISLWHRDARQQ